MKISFDRFIYCLEISSFVGVHEVNEVEGEFVGVVSQDDDGLFRLAVVVIMSA